MLPIKWHREGVSLIILPFCLTIVSCFSPAEDRKRLDEVNRIWKTFPLCPGMVEVNNSTVSGFGKAHVGKSFRSETKYDEVKRFYYERLPEAGWQLVAERPLSDWGRDLGGGRLFEFRRGEYDLSIQYAGEKSAHEWDYDISIHWRGSSGP